MSTPSNSSREEEEEQEEIPVLPCPIPIQKRNVEENVTSDNKIVLLFQEYSGQGGTISGPDALDILFELHISCDEAQLRALVASWEQIDYDTLLDVIHELKSGNGEVGKGTGEHDASGPTIVRLSTFDYLLFKLNPCAKTPRGTLYEREPISIDWTPKHSLIVLTISTTAFTGALLITMLSLFWITFALSRSEESVHNVNLISSRFAELYMDEIMSASAKESQDEAVLMGAYIRRWAFLEAEKHLNFSSNKIFFHAIAIRHKIEIARQMEAQFARSSMVLVARFKNTTSDVYALQLVKGPLDVQNFLLQSPQPAWFVSNTSRNASFGQFVQGFCWHDTLPQKIAFCNQSTSEECQQLNNLLVLGFDSFVKKEVSVAGWGYQVAVVPIYCGETAIVGMFSQDEFANEIRSLLVTIIDFMNFNFVRTTEIVIGTREARGDEYIVKQLNKFRFSEECLGPCLRRENALSSIVAGYKTKGSGFAVTVDYRPQPVLGSYSYIGGGLDFVLLFERDLVELHAAELRGVIKILDDCNKKISESSMEIQVVRHVGIPPMKLFSPNSTCERESDCVIVEGFGVVTRADCLHCMQFQEISNQKQIEALTMPRFALTNQGEWGSVAAIALELGHQDRSVYLAVDYRGMDVMASSSFLDNFSVGVLVKVDEKELTNPVTDKITVAIVSSCAFLVVVLSFELVLVRNVLRKVEDEWNNFRILISTAKKQYVEALRGVVPECIAHAELEGNRFIAAQETLCLMFSDVVGFSASTSNWHPQKVCQYFAYYECLFEAIRDHFGLYTVKKMGDCCLAVAGLENVGKQLDRTELSQLAVAALDCAVSLVQLTTPTYAHYPARNSSYLKVFGVAASAPFPGLNGRPDHVGCVPMPNVRIGLHSGLINAMNILLGNMQLFDVCGLPMSVLMKIHQSAIPGCVHLSSNIKDLVSKSDDACRFDFGCSRKTMVRNRGTFETFLLRGGNVPIPSTFFSLFGIRRAQRRIFYGERKEHGETSSANSESMKSTATYE